MVRARQQHHPDNAHFWASANAGRQVLPRCCACLELHWYPRPFCPHCGSNAIEWVEAIGSGTVYAVSVTHTAGLQPYAIAYVTLAEGVTMLSNIVDADLDTVRIGDCVELVFEISRDGQRVPMFRPVLAESNSTRGKHLAIAETIKEASLSGPGTTAGYHAQRNSR